MDKSRLLLALLATFSLPAVAHAQKIEPPDQLRWGQPKLDVYARLSAKPLRDRLFLGADLPLQVDLENLREKSADSTAVEDLGHNPGDAYLKFVVTGPRGNEINEVRKEVSRTVGFINNWTNLKPGEIETNTINLEERYDFREPGVYTVEIGFGEVRCRCLLVLEMPTEAEAEKLIQEHLEKTRKYNEQLKSQASQASGRLNINVKSFRNWRYFSPELWRFQPYLLTLLKHFDAFDFQFNPSICSIGTLESGRALVHRLESDPRLANEAAKMLASAVPSPEQRGAEPIGPNTPLPIWSDEFKAPLLKWARAHVASDNAELRSTAALMLGNLGKPSDFNLLTETLELLLKENEHFTAKRECRDLIKYCQRVFNSKPLRLTSLKNIKALGGPMNAYLVLKLAVPDRLNHSDSLEALETGIRHPNAFIRALALQYYLKAYNTKTPMPEVLRANLTQLMVDTDSEVSAAACEIAGRSKDQTLLPTILKVVSRAQPSVLLDKVIQAGYGLGASYDIWLTLADRLNEDEKWRFLETLTAVAPSFELKTVQQSKLPFPTPHLRENWLAFLRLHEKRLRAGQLIQPDEAQLIANLQTVNKVWFINGEKAIKTEEDGRDGFIFSPMGKEPFPQRAQLGASGRVAF